jgi:hypothetical protein
MYQRRHSHEQHHLLFIQTTGLRGIGFKRRPARWRRDWRFPQRPRQGSVLYRIVH